MLRVLEPLRQDEEIVDGRTQSSRLRRLKIKAQREGKRTRKKIKGTRNREQEKRNREQGTRKKEQGRSKISHPGLKLELCLPGFEMTMYLC